MSVVLERIFRPTPMTVPAHQVQPGDRILDSPVLSSEQDAAADFVWRIEGEGLVLRTHREHLVAIVRDVELAEDQCRECGREHSVKYQRLRLCGACYQRRSREAQR